MSRKNIVILINIKYKSGFISEFIESQKTKKDFLVEIANEFISNKNLNIDKIELPEVKRGRKSIYQTDEERKEAKRVTQKRYLENTRKKNPVLMEKDRERSLYRRNKIIYNLVINISLLHLSKIEEIIKPTGMKVSELFKKAVMEFLEENYKEENENAENLVTKK